MGDLVPFTSDDISDETALKALRMRRRGMDNFEIAKRLNMSKSTVAKVVGSALEAASITVGHGQRREALMLELQRLDDLQDAMWDGATGGDPRAAEAVLKIMKLRSELLGLDEGSDTGHTTVVVAGDSEAYIEAMRSLTRGTGA